MKIKLSLYPAWLAYHTGIALDESFGLCSIAGVTIAGLTLYIFKRLPQPPIE
jgi:hypothetical protein